MAWPLLLAGAAQTDAGTHTLTELTDEEGPQGSLLMVVLDVHIDHVHRLAGLLLSGVQIWLGQSDTDVRGPQQEAGGRGACVLGSAHLPWLVS